MPATPWSVSIFRVTKLRPGQVTITRAPVMRRGVRRVAAAAKSGPPAPAYPPPVPPVIRETPQARSGLAAGRILWPERLAVRALQLGRPLAAHHVLHRLRQG